MNLLIKIRYYLLAVSAAAVILVVALSIGGERPLDVSLKSNPALASSPAAEQSELLEANGAVPLENFTTSERSLIAVRSGTYKINITKEPENSNELLLWNTSNPSVCTVSPEGIVSAIKKGVTVITVSSASGAMSYDIFVDVIDPPDTVIDAPYITQIYDYPNGCESVSAVMALNYAGIDISVDEFIDRYLDMSPLPEVVDGEMWGYSPWDYFLGDPRDYSGLCCYAPVIVRAFEKFVDTNEYEIIELYGEPLDALCRDYISKGVPVILWATMYMDPPYELGWTWNVIDGDEGETFSWVAPIHCLLMTGYDDEYYYFNDPTAGEKVAYTKSSVETAYRGLFEQAIVIRKLASGDN